MKKEFDTLFVGDARGKLNEQEHIYFQRMLKTLQAAGVKLTESEPDGTFIIKPECAKPCGSECDGALKQDGVALVFDEAELARAKEAGLPAVYYSHTCEGGYGADMLLMSFCEIGFDFFQQVFDRFHGQPWTVVETRRCVVREAVLSDLDTFYEIYAQPSVAAFMDPLSEDPKEEQEKLKAYIRSQYPFYGFGTWTILDEGSGRIIGRAGLNVSDRTGGIQLGYFIREEYQHQGYAAEVCRGILKYARDKLELHELELEVDPGNINSLKLAKKLGFMPVGQGAMCCILLKIYL